MALTITTTLMNVGLTDAVVFTALADLVACKAPTFIMTGSAKFVMFLVETGGVITSTAVVDQLQPSVSFALKLGSKVHAIASAANTAIAIVVPNW